jgi:hypothetical protein
MNSVQYEPAHSATIQSAKTLSTSKSRDQKLGSVQEDADPQTFAVRFTASMRSVEDSGNGSRPSKKEWRTSPEAENATNFGAGYGTVPVSRNRGAVIASAQAKARLTTTTPTQRFRTSRLCIGRLRRRECKRSLAWEVLFGKINSISEIKLFGYWPFLSVGSGLIARFLPYLA